MNEEGKNKKKKWKSLLNGKNYVIYIIIYVPGMSFFFFFLHNQQIIHSFGLFLMFSDPVAAKWKANLPVKIVV